MTFSGSTEYWERKREKSISLHPDSGEAFGWNIYMQIASCGLLFYAQKANQYCSKISFENPKTHKKCWGPIKVAFCQSFTFVCYSFDALHTVWQGRETLTLANNRGKATANVSVIFVRSSSWVFFSLAVRTCAKIKKQQTGLRTSE